MIHTFTHPVSHIPLPEKFTYPFCYTPHPLCVLAAEEVKAYINTKEEWKEELNNGKMFGVLVIQDTQGVTGYLAAFSGNLAGKNLHPFFVPPIYDLLQPDGFFKAEEHEISAINQRIDCLENEESYREARLKLAEVQKAAQVALQQAKEEKRAAQEKRHKRRESGIPISDEEQAILIKESQFQKANLKRLEKRWKELIAEQEEGVKGFEKEIESLKSERKERSATLQQRLFEQFRVLNAKGEYKDLCTIFRETTHRIPPGGAGECALPKLLQYAYLHRLKPLAMAEFWWGHSPKSEVRYHGQFYPSCKGKCEPILTHMLQGLEVEESPLNARLHMGRELEIVFEDEWLCVVNKPEGMLSVPGKDEEGDSVFLRMRERYPQATGPLVVHRLDMATSGLLLIARSKEVYNHLQAQFMQHTIRKRYVALLDTGQRTTPLPSAGLIDLPLCLNPEDRPRQMVSREYGKKAVTYYQVIEQSGTQARVLFYPVTGRTHQLRVHAAHPSGLGSPIVGDRLYGKPAERLYLHAEYLEFQHPVYGETICLQKEADF